MLERKLRKWNLKVELLDGDVVRTHLSKGLGFSKEDRDINIRRIGFVCHLLTRNGIIAIASAISPYRKIRDEVRQRIENFIEVYVKTPLEECEKRDVKGLYKKARAGEIQGFTGVNDPYEEPLHPEVTCNTVSETAENCVEKIIQRIEKLGYLQLVKVKS